ncbi:30S ribosomal protein S4 [candidate division WOR-1 bacterium RIFOXYB2_FULL_48_7]|uniref:Small ribosomal subunit protein uS4 n=1 Tax=candidate division WOR-1 bacterium RIFOXYB2_FULL_48_7 TaxID=1802583 RepID=A0A1F4TTY0_UNCSA|nr:MAG: 30S ribosomal protein S4 [candidate division WOR-1 bacterium RIFOXYB2_FULL_48_7]
MGRHTAAACKLCRREGEKLFLKGERCFSDKCAFSRRSYAPGHHGKVPVRTSEYLIRLREKQKARRIYGIGERQFAKYFEIASQKKGATGNKLLEFLERRLDNVVYRLGFATSRQAGRQLVRHGNVLINGHKLNVPSYEVRVNDEVQVVTKAAHLAKSALEKFPDRVTPAWLALTGEVAGKIVAIPKREDIDTSLEESLIVEYYSR